MTEPERIKLIIDKLENGYSVRFSQKTGIQASTISRMLSGQAPIGKTRMATILATYPEISEAWLRTGEGYPGDLDKEDVGDKMNRLIAERDAIILSLTKEVERQGKIIAHLLGVD